jgi:hypothetical protein
MALPANALMLYAAALLLCAVSFAHTYMGERYLLMRIARRHEQLPKVFGSTANTMHTLRFGWHLASVAWVGMAGVLAVLANPAAGLSGLGLVIGGTFLIHFAVALIASRGKHLSWPVFLMIGILVIAATRG